MTTNVLQLQNLGLFSLCSATSSSLSAGHLSGWHNCDTCNSEQNRSISRRCHGWELMNLEDVAFQSYWLVNTPGSGQTANGCAVCNDCIQRSAKLSWSSVVQDEPITIDQLVSMLVFWMIELNVEVTDQVNQFLVRGDLFKDSSKFVGVVQRLNWTVQHSHDGSKVSDGSTNALWPSLAACHRWHLVTMCQWLQLCWDWPIC